ncbi:ribonuclease R [Ferrovum sp. PN-J185]|uniref:ribonuclease R n=1 Tax=Ferrovum sp. PN-J185 TaxID=1356306 RepID=UPI00079BB01F|nr:ribonuclease R [Ferrovum sp. PN-J185]KXW56968.1 ribonuclease R [Ferrovum sp. PN-J185]MCC6069159.1 ribonuclease R [Ferrovum sp. PN-J185]MDE1892389.1 ribonuclease R [Betaproteobacteria bacterium]MDE2057130.1 ribonuclease R [Betaproteobacteria bacterium]
MSNNKSILRSQDPFLDREKNQYDSPLPSREFILQILEKEGVPITVEKIERMLSIKSHERDLFAKRLRAMERDGQLMRNRKNALCLPEKIDLIPARIEGHPEGYGFAIRDDGGGDIFIGAREMHKVLHGDRVMVRTIGLDNRGRPEGAVVEVLQHVNSRLVARLHENQGVLFAVAENRRINQDLLVAPGQTNGARPGQVVMIEIMSQPSRNSEPIAKVVEIIGNYLDPGMEIEIALRKHELPYVFSKEVEEQTHALPDSLRNTDYHDREDIRHLPLVTIDGETAKDFDDAVYAEKLTHGGYRLIVAIADVSHYVREGDALDKEAFERGNSVYFPRRVIPMLPEKLSNGLCSLNPEVDRLCMVCDMTLSHEGTIKDYRFYPGVMHSKARLTYTEVAQALLAPQRVDNKLRSLLPHLQDLESVYRLFLSLRENRGAIDFSSSETRMIFDDRGKIETIQPVERNEAHRIIEECMLAANVCAANYLLNHQQSTLFRIHPPPTVERLKALRDFLGEFGLHLAGGDKPKAKDYAELLKKIQQRPDQHLLETVLLRSLQQAMYSPDNEGHFGLAYEAYTHFTSPIRRYPDLLVHRAIRAVLKGDKSKSDNLTAIGEHCSLTERRADEATRDVESWLKCFYMKDRVGEEFNGTVSSVTSFGLFVALDDVFVEGLVHISELGADYYRYDANRHQLLGERTGMRYRLGDRVLVQLVRVDMENNKIDFVLKTHRSKNARKKKTS